MKATKRTSVICALILGAWLITSLAAAQQAATTPAKPYLGKFYIVGMGPTPDLMTLRAARVCEKTSLFVLEEPGDAVAWKDVIGDRQVLYCPHSARVMYGMDPAKVTDPAARAVAERNQKIRNDVIRQIADAVKAGKVVTAAQWGDPMVYGTTFYLELLPADVETEVVPGLGAFEAGSAALKWSPTFGGDTNGVILTMGDWPGRRDNNDKLMALQTSMVIYTCGFKYELGFAQLAKYYPPDTPVAAVCFAGIPNQETVVRSTVGRFMKEVDYKNLPYLTTLFVGKFIGAGQARPDGLQTGKSMIETIHNSDHDHSEGPPAATKPATVGAAATGLREQCPGCEVKLPK